MAIGRIVVAMLALVAGASCTPSRPPSSSRVQLVPAISDRQLLRDLSLAVPDDASRVLPARPSTAAAPAFVEQAASSEDSERAADCLTAAVYYEARSEPLDGQRAVAQVVLNRVRDRAFPASVCRVVYQRTSTTCQFTFACDGSMNHPIQPRAWLIAQAVARAALAGSVYGPVGSATHYHTTAILPWWAPSLARIGTIGSHIFYRWSDRLSGALSFRQAYSGREVNDDAFAGPMSVADRGDGVVADEGGVAVHRGLSDRPAAIAVAGVRVHRGTVAPSAMLDEVADGAAPAD